MIGMLFGMSKNKALNTITLNPEKCIKKAKFRKSYKGTITIAQKKELEDFRNKEESILEKIEKKKKI